jgi:hypothetical protein
MNETGKWEWLASSCLSTDVCFLLVGWSESDASSLPLLFSVHFTILYVLVVLLVALFFPFSLS